MMTRNGTVQKIVAVHPTYVNMNRCCKRPIQLGFACEANSSVGDWISEQKPF